MPQTILALILALVSFFTLGLSDVLGADIINNPMIQFKTPMGIKILIGFNTLSQYEDRWGAPWEEIDLDRIDEFVKGWMDYLGEASRLRSPRYIVVKIQQWDERCLGKDEDIYAPYEFIHFRYGCIDGLTAGNTIVIHLGDDPGRDFYWTNPITGAQSTVITKGFCMTALGHELYHLMSGHRSNLGMPLENPPGLCD